jgi:Domain of unknown function (DUF5666)
MDTLTPDRQEDWHAYDDQNEQDERLPRRSRRQFFNRRVAALLALLTGAIGFYAGVRVEKGQLSSAGTGLTRPLGAVTGGAATGGAAGRAGGGAGGSAGGRGAGFGAFAGGAGGPGGANASFGTVASVNGKTIYLTEASGNTVKVKLSSATKISKTQSASRKAIRPGDTIVVSGVPGSGGTVSAATVTDSGVRTTGGAGASGTSGSGGASGSGSSGGGSKSAVGSLFSSGG